ncbi:MAG: DUF1579 domain-containing protein [Hyphomicrobiales bacterium]
MIRFIGTARRGVVGAATTFSLLSLLALPLVPSPARAADPATPDPQEGMMEAMAKYATPGPEHAVLQPMAGKWKAVTKMWMGPGDPQVSEGTTERSWIMGGRYLVSKHTGSFAGMPFEGMEILGYDRMHAQYVSTWIDNMGTGMWMSSSGSWDPAAKELTIVMAFDDPSTGKPTPYRQITKFVDDDTQVFRMVGSMNGQDYTQMEITYTRMK